MIGTNLGNITNVKLGIPFSPRGSVLGFSALLLAPLAACLIFTSCIQRPAEFQSKLPVLSSSNSNSTASVYLQEFSQADIPYNLPIEAMASKNAKWKVFFKRENSDEDVGGFYSLRILDTDSGNERILFTLWDADVGSGYAVRVRWSSDNKAVQLKGRTRGFSYSDREPAEFDYVYLVESDQLLSIPVSEVG